jgi:hypothetical protein
MVVFTQNELIFITLLSKKFHKFWRYFDGNLFNLRDKRDENIK